MIQILFRFLYESSISKRALNSRDEVSKICNKVWKNHWETQASSKQVEWLLNEFEKASKSLKSLKKILSRALRIDWSQLALRIAPSLSTRGEIGCYGTFQKSSLNGASRMWKKFDITFWKGFSFSTSIRKEPYKSFKIQSSSLLSSHSVITVRTGKCFTSSEGRDW